MRKLLALALAVVSAVTVMVFNCGNAAALSGGEWLGCRIAPGYEFNFYQTCSNTMGPDEYGNFGVAFRVQNETAPSTYTWTIPAPYQSSISTGCTATSNWCTIQASASRQTIDVSVTLTQGSASETFQASAYITPEYCDPYCL